MATTQQRRAPNEVGVRKVLHLLLDFQSGNGHHVGEDRNLRSAPEYVSAQKSVTRGEEAQNARGVKGGIGVAEKSVAI